MDFNNINSITFDFDYNHNIFETLTPYYQFITKINYITETSNGIPTISITFINLEILNKFKIENYLE